VNVIDGTVTLDEADKALLQTLQDDFPLITRPWDALAERLGTTPEDVMGRIGRLKEEGVIRRIGPVLETDKVGLTARTLVLMKVPPERMDEVAEIVSGFDEVTHNYERDHEYNLWFTLITPSQERLKEALAAIIDATGVSEEGVLNLPVTERYKIGVRYVFR
jgi:DNA-binding Lrp family transcriptional regulator